MTVKKTARFEVSSDRLAEGIDAIRAFVDHTTTEPGAVAYASWQSATRPTEFLHFMEFVDADAEQAHASSDAVKVFTSALYPLCLDTPVFEDWRGAPEPLA